MGEAGDVLDVLERELQDEPPMFLCSCARVLCVRRRRSSCCWFSCIFGVDALSCRAGVDSRSSPVLAPACVCPLYALRCATSSSASSLSCLQILLECLPVSPIVKPPRISSLVFSHFMACRRWDTGIGAGASREWIRQYVRLSAFNFSNLPFSKRTLLGEMLAAKMQR